MDEKMLDEGIRQALLTVRKTALSEQQRFVSGLYRGLLSCSIPRGYAQKLIIKNLPDSASFYSIWELYPHVFDGKHYLLLGREFPELREVREQARLFCTDCADEEHLNCWIVIGLVNAYAFIVSYPRKETYHYSYSHSSSESQLIYEFCVNDPEKFNDPSQISWQGTPTSQLVCNLGLVIDKSGRVSIHT